MTADLKTEVVRDRKGNFLTLTKEGAALARRKGTFADLDRIAKGMRRLANPPPVTKVDEK